ncbi:MAG: DUF2213 domain-containing protein [Campylobacterota bacterium]|nr:DUF2213 domain-containing protein [Campylobacterota bacterium]
MKINTFDNFGNFTKNIDEETGFMHINGVVSRSGCQTYLGMEISNDLEPMKTYNVYRPKDEVLHKDSLATFINSTVTDEHPQTFVTTDNVKELQKGSSAGYETLNKDGIDYVKAKLVVTDKDLIDKIQSGKVGISAGYSHQLIKEKGTFDGQEYDFKQTNIRINHIAIVQRGRCGNECKITDSISDIILNSTNKQRSTIMAKLMVGDAEFEVNDAIATAYADMQSKVNSKDEELEKSKKDLEEKDMENGKLAGENEKLKKEKKEAGDIDIHALANDRAVLLAQVSTQIGDADVSKMTDSQIKVLALSKVSDMDLKDKSDEFVAGVFDTMLASKANDSINAFGESITKDGGQKVSARDAYVAKLKGAK